MKRFLGIFSIIMFLVLTFAIYYSYHTESYQKLIDSTETYTYKFQIPEDTINANPKRLTSLKKAAKKNGVNIIRTISYYDNEKKNSYTEAYLLLTSDTRLFRNMNMTEGRSLTKDDMNSSDRFISTEKTDSVDQVGVISDFGGNNYYSIYLLDNLISNYRYSGQYRLEAASREQFNQFISDYVDYVNAETGENFSSEMYTNVTRANQTEVNNAFDVKIVGSFFVVIMFFTFLFYLVARTKEISVMKLNGYTTRSICVNIFVRFFTKVFLFSMLLTIPWMFFIKDNNFEFIRIVYTTNMIVYIILMIILTSLCYFYTRFIRITSSVKGKRPIGIIVIINGMFKVAISIVILISAVSMLTYLNQISQKQNTLDNWSKASNYGVFYPVMAGNDSNNIRDGEYPLDIPTYKLYPYLNERFQSIYIDSSLYTEESLKINSGNDYVKYITVNPNYLKEYPIFDTEGNPIEISEEIEHSVYLVPEQYKKMEGYNLDYFTLVRELRYELHSDLYDQKDKVSSTEIEFVYTKSGQDIFTMNPDVMPDNNNMIVDPIIKVMTEANALVPDTFYTATSNQTLFIKLINNNAEVTYNELLSKLQEYELNDNFPYLVHSNEVILKEINDLQQEATIVSYILLFMSLLLIMILFQNIYLQFARNRFVFFLKKTFGHTFLMKYKKILLLLLLTNLIEFIVCFMMINSEFYTVFIGKMLIEIGLVILFITYFERKNVTEILREGV